MSSSIAMRYGRGELELAPPPGAQVEVLRLSELPEIAAPEAALRAALDAPIGTAPLRELARGKREVCIVICDVTRPVPNEPILDALLEVLASAGVARNDVTVLVATGLHRPNEGAELEEMIGAQHARSLRVENHFARDESAMHDLGEIEWAPGHRTRAAINARYIHADLKITTGLIEPHFMAGYSGGRKVICPGIASAATIRQFHCPPMIGDQNARAGHLPGNPIHAMSLAVARRAGCDFIVNVTLSETRRITGIFAGAMEAAHARGIEHVDQSAKVEVVPAPIVVTSSAGFPLDTTFYQSIKGMVCALPALEPGGTLIIAAGLTEGIGGPEFEAMCHRLGDLGVEEFLRHLYNSPVEIDQWQLQELTLALRHAGEIVLVSSALQPSLTAKFGLHPEPSLEAALERARARHGQSARIIAIPEGPYVTPVAVAAREKL